MERINSGCNVSTYVPLGTTDILVLGELTHYLSKFGYSEFVASFAPLGLRYEKWIEHRLDASEELRSLIELFLYAQPVALERLPNAIGVLVPALCNLGILAVTISNWVHTPDLILIPVFGQWLFCQRPQLNPTLYFGDDSIALLLRLRPRHQGHALDLCAGPGVQSLYCSLFAEKVTAVEINPVAAALARLNVAMNGCDGRIQVYCGDLYEPVRGQRFDTIVANPPLLPFPEEHFYPFVGHGGVDGLRVTWQILHGLPTALTMDGTAQLIGTCLSDGILPLWVDDLESWARETGLDVLMTITAHQPLKPGTRFFDSLVYTATAGVAPKVIEVTQTFQQSLFKQGASALCAYFLRISHGCGTLKLLDLSREGHSGLWYV